MIETRSRARVVRRESRIQRVLVVGHQFEGASERHLEATERALDVWRWVGATGLHVTRLCPATDRANALALASLSSGNVAVAPRTMLPKGPPLLARFHKIDRIVSSVRPDVVHIMGELWQVGVHATVRAARRAGASCGVQFAENGPGLEGIPGKLRDDRARSLVGQLDYVIGWSRSATRLATERWAYMGPAHTFPGSGVDEAFFHVSRKTSSREPTILFVGRLSREKGIEDALAFARAIRSHGVRTVIAGAGPMRDLVLDAAEAGIVEYAGYHPTPELPALFASADLTLVPSRSGYSKGPGGIPFPLAEQFGRVIVESMATGTPVLAYRVGEIPEAMGPSGFLVSEGDLGGLTSAALEILRDRTVWAGASERGRVWAERFSNQKIAKNLTRVWADL